MAQILVRQLASEAHHALKARARQRNRSAESLAREILERSLVPESRTGLGSRIAAPWDGAGLSGVDLERDRTPCEPMDLQ
ncbi:MAG: plasmid stabilization protein [Boseongicola sp. SB0673_bin_14]|nr:plasmid stabilization protein [Boseongicola sp. SB0673_bin_14]